MALVVPNALLATLEDLWDAAVLTGAVLRTFQNNHVPAVGDNVAAYTESTFVGYAAFSLPAPPAAVFAVDRATKTWASHAFACTGGGAQNVYGYYVTSAGGALLWAEAYTFPPLVIGPGVSYTVTPVLSLKQF